MTIQELREARNKAWEGAKAFVESKRDKDGLLSKKMQRPMPKWKRRSRITALKSKEWSRWMRSKTRCVSLSILHRYKAGN